MAEAAATVKTKRKIHRTKGDVVFDTIIYIITGLMILLALYPMYFVVIASISNPTDVSGGNVTFFPTAIDFKGYAKLFDYYVIVARTFFSNSLPDDLWEAAQIDGCGNLRFFFQIVLPLSKAVIAVIALWTAVGQWNGYFNALIYLRSPELQPLQIVLRNILIGNQTIAAMSTGSAAVEAAQLADLIKYAIIVISSAPIMCMYPFVQKYFNQGVMIGALKG